MITEDTPQRLELPLGTKRAAPAGRRATPLYGRGLEKLLFEKFGRHNLGIKVFRRDSGLPFLEYRWGSRHKLIRCTQVQNLAAKHSLAPRVYAIMRVDWDGKECFAQVVDWVRGAVSLQHPGTDLSALKGECCLNQYIGSGDPKNWRGCLLLDFETLCFADDEKYEESLVDRAYELDADLGYDLANWLGYWNKY